MQICKWAVKTPYYLVLVPFLSAYESILKLCCLQILNKNSQRTVLSVIHWCPLKLSRQFQLFLGKIL